MLVNLKMRLFISILERQHPGDTIFHLTVTHPKWTVKPSVR